MIWWRGHTIIFFPLYHLPVKLYRKLSLIIMFSNCKHKSRFKSHFKFHFNRSLKMDFWNIISHNRKFVIFVVTSQENRCCRIVQVWQDWGRTEGWVRCKLKIGLLYLHALVHPKEVILRAGLYSPDLSKCYFLQIHTKICSKVPIFYFNRPKRPPW